MANQVITTSKKFTLNLNDWWKGLVMAVGAPVIAIIMDSLNSGGLVFNWKLILIAAVSAAGTYILKNLFSPATIMMTGVSSETIDDIKAGDATMKVVNK